MKDTVPDLFIQSVIRPGKRLKLSRRFWKMPKITPHRRSFRNDEQASLQKIVIMSLLQVRPAHNPDPFVTVIVRAAVNQSGIDRLLPCQGRPPFQAGKEIRCHGPAGFDLQRHEPLPLLDEQIYLHAVAVPPEIEGGPLGAVEERLHQLRHHKGFKEASP